MSFGIPVRNGLSISLLSTTALSSGRRLVPALDLNLLSGPLDPRITFSRGSNATLVDATGKLTYAPNNLLTHSEQFDNAAWTKTEITVTSNVAIAPNGTTTADNCVPTTNATTHQISTAVIISAAPCVMSVYAKGNGYNTIVILDRISASNGASFDLTTGVATNIGTGIGSAVAVGNGWYRCSVAATTTGMRIYIPSASSVFAGNGTSGVYLWGAQLEAVTYQTTPGTYNPTTVKNLLGYTQEFDNAAWTKSNAFVQTNLLTYSNTFNGASWSWASGAAGTLSQNVLSPDGNVNAWTITDTDNAATQLIQQSVTLTATNHTFSCYFKKTTGAQSTYPVMLVVNGGNLNGAVCTVDTTNGVATVWTAFTGWTIVTSTATCTDAGSYWRVSLTFLGQSAGFLMRVAPAATSNPTQSTGTLAASLTGSTVIYGAQLVQGSTAGDYQRTDAAAAAVQYTAPDGTLSADKLVETTAASSHYALQAATVAAAPYTFSTYAKAGERSFVSLAFDGLNAWFNLSTGAVGTVEAGLTASITAVGNGWYRCAIFRTVSVAGSKSSAIYPTNANNVVSYTGDGTSGIYIWGAQLSDSASLDPYAYNPVAAPTAAAYYGPRFDYDPVTLAAKGLLIEEQRTNLLTRSEEFDNASTWITSNATISANSTLAPNGLTVADRLTEGAGAQARFGVYFGFLTTTALAPHTFSVFVKNASGSRFARIVLNTATGSTFACVDVNPATGSIAQTLNSGAASVSSSSVSMGNGWWRVSITATLEVRYVTIALITGASVPAGTDFGYQAYTGDGTSGIFLYGAQLEAGSFATSYIPTVASTVTRSADVALMQGANFSSWYNQNEGTFSVSVDSVTTGYRTNLQVDDGTLNNRILIQTNNVATAQQYYVVVGGSAVVNTSAQSFSPTGSKTSAGYRLNDYAYSVNGAAVTTDTSATVPAVSRMFLGTEVSSNYLNGHIRSIGYYNTRLPNTTLQTLTAPPTTTSLFLDFTTQVFNVG